MKTTPIKSGTLQIQDIEPQDLVLFGEADQLELHLQSIGKYWEAMMVRRSTGRPEAGVVSAAMRYLAKTGTTGCEQTRELGKIAMHRWDMFGERVPGGFVATLSDVDQIRADAGRIWSVPSNLLVVGRSLADIAVGAFLATERAAAIRSPVIVDDVLRWLEAATADAMTRWNTRSVELVDKHYPWMSGWCFKFKPVPAVDHRMQWEVSYEQFAPAARAVQ